VRNGPLEVIPVENGPLHVKGSLEIVSGTGRTLKRVTECWLCRCGHSGKKPYCDGSHRKTGFTAPGLAPARK
jgi:CDGSH-type Zn-finger protein